MNFKIIIFLHAPFSYKPPLESAQLSLCSSKTARYNYVLSLHLLGGGMFGYPLSLYLSLVSLLFLQYRYFDFQINHPPVLVIIIFQVIPALRKNKNITTTTTTTTTTIIIVMIIIIIIIMIIIIIIIIIIKWPAILVLHSYIAREYVNSRWINVKCPYIENQAFFWKGLIELTQFTQNEPTTW